MDYLIYLSKSKIAMLYEQLVPGVDQQIGAEIGGNVGFLSAKLTTLPSAPGLYEKAGMVERYIGRTCGLGSLSEPREWIRDRCEARYVCSSFTPSMFLLVGRTPSGYFLLGGSPQNVVGNESAASIKAGLSYLPYFLNAFKVGFAAWEKVANATDVWLDKEHAKIHHSSGHELALSVRELYVASEDVSPLRVKFVARRLAREVSGSGETHADVYSPLYVALDG